MKGKEEDDDGKPKSTNGSTQIKDFPVHVELEHQPDCSSFQLMQVREVAGSMEFASLQTYYMRILFHIGGF